MDVILGIFLFIIVSGIVFAFIVCLFTGDNRFEGESYFSLGGMLGAGLHNLIKGIFQCIIGAVEEKERRQSIDEQYKKAIIELNEREKNQK
ncbi:MAG: hypothetical protein IJ523_01645 [Succinivibrionaceae bacterium]|nr:hypothetical protein [Succinivibrionaceae bacterium]